MITYISENDTSLTGKKKIGRVMYSSANSTFLYINGSSLHGYVTVVTGFLHIILSMIGFSCFVCTCKLTKQGSHCILKLGVNLLFFRIFVPPMCSSI